MGVGMVCLRSGQLGIDLGGKKINNKKNENTPKHRNQRH
jgi:hypothetical protein